MSSLLIKINVAGQPPAVPGESREFLFPVIDPAAPLVTLSVVGAPAGCTYSWEILDAPVLPVPVLSDPTSAAPTFTPVASTAGTYMIRCEVNGGYAQAVVGLSFRTENYALRKLGVGETLQFARPRGWTSALNEWVDAIEALSGGPGPVNTGWEEYWIDAINGVDDASVGRGSLLTPFATLDFAAQQVAPPLDALTFQRPVVFHLNSGIYSAPVALPAYRWSYAIDCGAGGVAITGAMVWVQNNDFRFGTSVVTFPNTLFVNGGSASYVGDVTAVRDVADAGGGVGVKNLTFLNCRMTGQVTNAASGDPLKPTGDMRLGFADCLSVGSGVGVLGEDEDTFITRNRIFLVTQDSLLTRDIRGDIVISSCSGTVFGVIGAAPDMIATDIIEGYNFGLGAEGPGFRDCTFTGPCLFGSGHMGFTIPEDRYIRFDSPSFLSAVRDCSSAFALFDAPAHHGDDEGFRLMDEGYGVRIRSWTALGHLLPEDNTAQKVADRLDWLEGTQVPFIDIYVDPPLAYGGVGVGSDDNDGAIATPLATCHMAKRRLGTRPFRCPVRVHIVGYGTDILPATWPIILEESLVPGAPGGSFAIMSAEDPTLLETLEIDSVTPGVFVNGYACTRLTFTTILGGWGNDPGTLGAWLLPDPTGGGANVGKAWPIGDLDWQGTGANGWIEIARPFNANFHVGDTVTIIRPTIKLIQTYPVVFTVEDRGINTFPGTGGTASVAISNLILQYGEPPH